MVIDKTVKVSKEASELGVGLVKFVADIKKALEDGWQLGQDLPLVLQATMIDLVPAIQGVDQLGVESKENEKAFVSAFGLALVDMVYLFKK